MRSQNLLIIAGHAWQCLDCQNKLLRDPSGAVALQSLTAEERSREQAAAPILPR
ncbi:MAG: hypothetical protein HZY76_19000 [Anaerolineae bacterium]|nr:MAG: hypothetical protein HZY76_19000 [Anaerolineae bacterium]